MIVQQTDKQNFYSKLQWFFLNPEILFLILICLLNILGSSLQTLGFYLMSLLYMLGFYSKDTS